MAAVHMSMIVCDNEASSHRYYTSIALGHEIQSGCRRLLVGRIGDDALCAKVTSRRASTAIILYQIFVAPKRPDKFLQ